MLNNAIEKNDEEKVKQAKEEVKQAKEEVKQAKEEVKQAKEEVKEAEEKVKAAEEKAQKAKPEKAIRHSVFTVVRKMQNGFQNCPLLHWYPVVHLQFMNWSHQFFCIVPVQDLGRMRKLKTNKGQK